MCTLCVLFTLLLCHVTSPAPVIPAPWGSIQGIDMEGRGGRKLSGYLGIPYARPPTGELRWQKPHPHPGPGEGKVFVADTVVPACPQDTAMLGVTAGTNEDCLTLDVYVPATVTSPRPVMVFIHGGGMVYGESAPYRPFKLVADGDVIVVAIQYRLGTLGFLSTGDDTLPGNLGLWDQNLALRWVKDNIRAFGGDPEVVTLFGESAGGWSTGLLIVSPYSKGLFHRAILQSGSPQTAISATSGTSTRVAFKELSRLLDCEADTDKKAVECLKTRSADDIVNKTNEWMVSSGFTNTIGVRVDGDFIPRDPVELTGDEQYVQEVGMGDIDVIIGFNNKEGAIITIASELEGSPMEGFSDAMMFTSILEHAVKQYNNGQTSTLLNAVVDFFYRGADAGSNNSVPLDALVNLFGDMMFYAHTVEWLRPLAAQPHKGSRYLYVMEHDFHFNRNRVRGSHHGDELWLQFDMVFPEDSMLPKLNKSMSHLSEEDEKMSDLFVKIWTDFAKTGNPNAPLRTALGGDWPEFTSENEAYLSLSLTPQVGRDVMRDRVALWLQLVPQIVSITQRQGEQPTPADSAKDEL